jgi:thymidylate synthase
MEIIHASSITDLYYQALRLLRDKGSMLDSRAGKTVEATNVCSILTDTYSRLILDRDRKHSLDYLKKEFLWYMLKDPDISFIKKHAKFWGHVTEDSIANSNYGCSIFSKRFNYGLSSQYDLVKDELTRMPATRRAWWGYTDDKIYNKMSTTKDFPCTLMSHFMIRKGKLDQAVYMRSNDLIYGWCNDLPFFSMMQEMLAVDLGLEPGILTHMAGSLHIYERHFPLLKSPYMYVQSSREKPWPRMTKDDVDYLKQLPEVVRSPDTNFLKFLYA